MEQLDAEERLLFPKTQGGRIRLKQYLDESPGVPLQNNWTDVSPVGSRSEESLSFPTQKPLALLERVVSMASNEGDVVLDPFCGCGTTIAAAHGLGRAWIGIDITHLAINLVRTRLLDMYPDAEFQVIGEPVDEAGAWALAIQNRYQFEWWALALVEARPASGERKRGADTGVDGVLYFVDDPKRRPKKAVVQVKSGKVGVGMVRDFARVIQREKAALGLFVTLEPPTAPMLTEAASVGVYQPELPRHEGTTYPRLQILTVGDLLGGAYPALPSSQITYRAAQRAAPGVRQLDLPSPGEDE